MQLPKTLDQIDLNHKSVLLRLDLNVPMDEAGRITDATRIERALDTIDYCLQHNAGVMIVSHLGRPDADNKDKYSLKPVAKMLEQKLNRPVRFVTSFDDLKCQPGEVVFLENIRYFEGEIQNDTQLASKLIQHADVFVNDAFATSHRMHASTCAVADLMDNKAMGLLMQTELEQLSAILSQPKKPMLAIVGGAKVSTKIAVLQSLLTKVDALIVGGGIANTFLAAAGFNVGASLYEKDYLKLAQTLMQQVKQNNIMFDLPKDVVVVKTFDQAAPARTINLDAVENDDIIIDVGAKTLQCYQKTINAMKSILWNGPLGVFEWTTGKQGTHMLAEAIATSKAHCVAGGGDTLAAIKQFQVHDQIDYLSTGGGAFLQLAEGKSLPAVDALLNQSHVAVCNTKGDL